MLVIVKRPDLTDRVESQVRASTLKMHHSDFYYRDLVEVSVEFSEELFIQNFIPTEVVPKFRKVKYIRIWRGNADGMPGQFLTPIQIENSNDAYGYIKENVFYMAGQMLQVRTSTALKRILFGAYVHPTITPDNAYTSWIADEYPFAIIYEAARAIFRSIGFQEQANEYAQLAGEVLGEIKLSCVDDVPLT
ncbi:hypothetical protein D3C72_1382440 [compost metagenome]